MATNAIKEYHLATFGIKVATMRASNLCAPLPFQCWLNSSSIATIAFKPSDFRALVLLIQLILRKGN